MYIRTDYKPYHNVLQEKMTTSLLIIVKARLFVDHSLSCAEAVVMATRRIEEGEEICLSYLPNSICSDSMFLRRLYLQRSYAFLCNCSICSSEESNAEMLLGENADALLENVLDTC